MRRTFIILALLGLWPCVSAQAEETSQIVLYLERIPFSEFAAQLSFDSLTLHVDSDSLNLSPLFPAIEVAELTGRQRLLAEAEVPPGRGRSLDVAVTVQVAHPEGEGLAGKTYRQVTSLPLNVALSARNSVALFLKWEQMATGDTLQPFRSTFSWARKQMPPLTARAYVSNERSGNLSILDPQRGEVVGCLRVGSGPKGLAISRRLNYLYVANAQGSTITILDLQTHQHRGVINLDFGDEPQALCLSRDERLLFSANRGSNSVTVMDAERFIVTAKILAGNAPLEIAADASSSLIYVANSLSDDISVLDAASLQVVHTLPVGSYPQAIEFAPTQKSVYIANFRSAFVTRISTPEISVVEQMNLSRGISDLAYDALAGMLYCALSEAKAIAVFKPDLKIELTQISVGGEIQKMKFDPRGNLLYVCCAEDNSISVINRITNRVEKIIAAGRGPYEVIFP